MLGIYDILLVLIEYVKQDSASSFSFTSSNAFVTWRPKLGVDDYSISSRSIIGFNLSHSSHIFEDRFFLVTHVNPGARAIICGVANGVKGRCTDLLSKYWTKGHFLMENNFFVYSEKDLSEEFR